MYSESLCDGAKSPTFPQSSRQSGFLSEKDQGDIGGLSPEPCGSTFSSQDSLSSSVIVTSGRSPVFPRTGPSSSETRLTVRSPVVQMTEALQMSRSLNKTQIPAAALSPVSPLQIQLSPNNFCFLYFSFLKTNFNCNVISKQKRAMFCCGVTNLSNFLFSHLRLKMSGTHLVQVKCYVCFMCDLTCSSVTV